MTSTASDKAPGATASAPASVPAAGPAPAAPKPASDLVTLTINGTAVTAKKGTLLVEAAKAAGIDIPVFCYHEKLKPVGACRMCLVEIDKMPRLQTACTTPVGEGMVVKTQSELAKGGQNAVLALLLANHPLDCPICDKGGECPLQDNTFSYGPGQSKFEEEKRHNDKAFELSDKIVLDRERCILCYRCVRFHEEIPGDRALAVIDRGSRGEIGVAPGDTYDSPFQGNTIDICPVGALTSRQYRFRSRPWDLTSAPAIAADDPTGANILVDTRDGRVLRVRPRENAAVNDVWIADSTRFDTVPAERSERLQTPLVRQGGVLVPTTWFGATRRAAQMLRAHNVAVLAAPTLTNEALGILASGALTEREALGVWPPVSPWPCTGSIASIAKSKRVVVVGMDPWTELPSLALWIHRAVANTAAGPGGAKLVAIHTHNGLFRDTHHWVKSNDHADTLVKLQLLVAALEGKTGSLSAVTDALRGSADAGGATILAGTTLAQDPVGRDLLHRLAAAMGADGTGGLVGAPSFAANGRGALALIGDNATRTPALLRTGNTSGVETLVLIDTDAEAEAFGGGVHGIVLSSRLHKDAATDDSISPHVDVVLPLVHTYEQAGSFTSLENRVQSFAQAAVGPREAKADWEALGLLAAELSMQVPNELYALRAQLAQTWPETFQPIAAAPVGKAKSTTSTRARAGLRVVS